MRKILFFLLTYLLASSAVYTQEIKVHEASYNYFHDIQLGVTLAFTEIGPIPLAELSTSHGICFTERFSAGIGVSTIYFMTITPYVVGRVNLKAKDRLSKNTPYLSLKAGYMVYLVKGDSDYNSLNLEPRLGFSHLRKNGKSSWSYFISANAFQGRVFPKIGVGFEL